jgi:spermidine synthase
MPRVSRRQHGRSEREDFPKAVELADPRPISTGTAELVRDQVDPRGWTVLVNGVPSSYVHADPLVLGFEYLQWFGVVLDALAPAGAPLRVSHVGGAGCTMARYVAAARPGSVQVAYEVDAELVTLVRQAFDLRRVPGLRIRAQDGRAGLAEAPAAVADVVIRDAFAGAFVPASLTTGEWLAVVRRVLRPGGCYLANVADRADLSLARREAATALRQFAHVALIAEPGQLRGRRYGNVVLVASDAALPDQALVRALASAATPARLVATERVVELASGAQVFTDDEP